MGTPIEDCVFELRLMRAKYGVYVFYQASKEFNRQKRTVDAPVKRKPLSPSKKKPAYRLLQFSTSDESMTYCNECQNPVEENLYTYGVCKNCSCAECGETKKRWLTQDAFKCLDPQCGAINIINPKTNLYEVVVDSLGTIIQ
jgi:hypothetical protein